jgi:hypothetical protein
METLPCTHNTQYHLHTFFNDIIQGKITEQKKYYIHKYFKHLQNSEDTNSAEYISEMKKQSFKLLTSWFQLLMVDEILINNLIPV